MTTNRAGEAPRGSGEWWARRLASEPVAVVVTDEHGTIRRWGTEAQRLYGYTAQEARGADIAALLAPRDTVDDARRVTALRVAGDITPRRTRVRCRDGSILELVTCVGRAFEDGAPVLVGAGLPAGDVDGPVGTPDATTAEWLRAAVAQHAAALRASDTAASLTALQRVGARLAGASSAEDVGDVAVKETLEAVGAGAVALFDTDGKVVARAASGDVDDADVIAARDRALVGALTAVHARWPAGSPASSGAAPVSARWPSVASVPLSTQRGRVGTLAVAFVSVRQLALEERTLLEAIGDVTAQALSRARLVDSVDTSSSHVDALQRITAGLAAARTRDDVVHTLFVDALSLTGAASASVALLDDDRFVLHATAGYHDDVVQAWSEFPADADVPTTDVIRSGAPVFVSTRDELYTRYPLFRSLPVNPDTNAIANLPLAVEGQPPFGVLHIGFRTARRFVPREREFLTAVANQAAVALHRVDLNAGTLAALAATARAREQLERRFTTEQTARLAAEAILLANDDAEVGDDGRGTAAVALEDVLERVCTLVDADDVTLFVVSDDVLVPRASTGSEARRAAETVAAQVVRTRRAVVGKATAAVPLLAGARVIGVLTATNREATGFDDERVEQLTAVAERVAWSLERSSLLAAERHARASAEAAQARITLLAEASRVVASLDEDAVLDAMARLVVPAFADWSSVYRDRDGALERVAGCVSSPEADAASRQLLGLLRFGHDSAAPVMRVWRTGRTLLAGDTLRDVRRVLPDDAVHLIESLGLGPGLFVPVNVRGRTIAVLTFARLAGRRPFDDDDIALAEELAVRVAVSLSHARAYELERSVAETLSHAALPQSLPQPPGWQLAARYLPAARGAEVGGDWYDAFRIDESLAVVVGDVAGHGVAAARVMTQLRNSMRALALDHRTPLETVAGTDAVVAASDDPSTFATAICATVDPATGACTWVSAGHPPPLLVTADEARFLEGRPGTPVGVTWATRPQHDVVLPHDASVVLYTDGLVEDRETPLETGLERLRETAVELARAAPDVDAERLVDALVSRLANRSARVDDCCVFVVRRRGPSA